MVSSVRLPGAFSPLSSIDLLGEVTGIDVFIDGHSHSTLEQVLEATEGTGKVGETYLTSTGTKLANVGVVTIRWKLPELPAEPRRKR